MGGAALPRRFGEYELQRILGTGAIATTYLATTDRFGVAGQQVVLKQIHAYLAEQAEEVDLFLSEAQVLAALSHPAIGAILDLGTGDGAPYLALEFLSGRDLSAVLVQRAKMKGRPLALPLCLWIGQQIAEALAHAHAACDASGRSLHIVHRDVSPNNVILCFDGRVKLLDFGIARSALRSTRTTVGMIRGTPGYMSPEQLRGDWVDGRSDVFVLGALLYRLIAGEPAFPVVAGDLDSYRRPLTETPAPLHLRRPEVPEEVSLLIGSAMQQDLVARLEGAAQFAQALKEQGAQLGQGDPSRALVDLMGWLFPEAAYLIEHPVRRASKEKVLERQKALSYVSDEEVGFPDWEDPEFTVAETHTADPERAPARTQETPEPEADLDRELTCDRTVQDVPGPPPELLAGGAALPPLKDRHAGEATVFTQERLSTARAAGNALRGTKASNVSVARRKTPRGQPLLKALLFVGGALILAAFLGWLFG